MRWPDSPARPRDTWTAAHRHRRGRRPEPRTPWIQADCALFRSSDGSAPPAPWRELRTLLDDWRAGGRIRQAFFLRKPPGLRLRVLPSDRTSDIDVELAAAMAGWKDAQAIRGWRFAVYEPETARFGGAAGMAIAHEQFDVDTRTAMDFECLPAPARAGVDRALFSLAAVNNLLAGCVGDMAELRDVWARLDESLRGYAIDGRTHLSDETIVGALTISPAFVAALPGDASAVLALATRRHALVVPRIRSVVTGGRFDTGLRGWLADLCVFHWNRMGLLAGDVQPLVGQVARILREA